MFNFIKQLLYPELKLKEEVNSIAQAFGYPDYKFDLLISQLLENIKDSDESKIKFFNEFINNPSFKKFNLNLRNPKDMLLLGYAFCSAMILDYERQVRSQKKIEEVLRAFQSPKKLNGT